MTTGGFCTVDSLSCMQKQGQTQTQRDRQLVDLPWVVSAVLGVNVEFFTLEKKKEEDK